MDRIYLDYAATAPVLPEVLDAMLPFFMSHISGLLEGTHIRKCFLFPFLSHLHPYVLSAFYLPGASFLSNHPGPASNSKSAYFLAAPPILHDSIFSKAKNPV